MPLAHAVVGGRGDRPPLVLLHGLFGSHGNFQTVAKALVRGGSGKVRPWGAGGGVRRAGGGRGWGNGVSLPRQVVTVDARNHGGSPHSPLMTYEAMSLDVQHLLTRLGIAKCILLGHSMGGKTAMTLALQRVGGRGAPGAGWGEREAAGRGVAPAGAAVKCQPCSLPRGGWLFSVTVRVPSHCKLGAGEVSVHQPMLRC